MSEPLFQDRTSRLDLPLLFAGQAQKETYVNEALTRLDALLHCAVEAQVQTPPSAPQEGQCWLVGAGPGGAWSGQAGAVACFQQGQWLFQQPRDGLRLLNKATGQYLHHFGFWQTPAKPALPAGGATIDAQSRAAIAAIVETLIVAGILAAQ